MLRNKCNSLSLVKVNNLIDLSINFAGLFRSAGTDQADEAQILGTDGADIQQDDAWRSTVRSAANSSVG